MELLSIVAQVGCFVFGVIAIIAAGTRILPAAELLFSEDTPEDAVHES